MELFWLGLSLWVMANLQKVRALPGGAPSSACATLMPNHTNISPQTSPNPYAITISDGSTTYTDGQKVKLKVTGMGDFKGLFIQARKKGMTDIVGTFEDPGLVSGDKLKFRPCPNDNSAKNGVTHSNVTNVMQPNSFELTWMAPNSDMGDIGFVATVAQGRSKYWLNVMSPDLKYSSGSDSLGSGVMRPYILGTLFALFVSVGIRK